MTQLTVDYDKLSKACDSAIESLNSKIDKVDKELELYKSDDWNNPGYVAIKKSISLIELKIHDIELIKSYCKAFRIVLDKEDWLLIQEYYE